LKIILDKKETVWYNTNWYKIKLGEIMFNLFKIFSKKNKIDEVCTGYKEFIIKNKFINHEVIKKNVLWIFKNKDKK
jgi:hypothetical protein